MLLYIESTNAASYISAKTGVIADIEPSTLEGNQHKNYYVFDKNDEEVMEAFHEYREAVRSQSELNVDAISFMNYFSLYRKKSRQLRNKRRK